MTRQYYTREEVAKHNTVEDIWVIANNKVYNVTSYLRHHPGGQFVIKSFGGKDATKHYLNHNKRAQNLWKKLKIGYIKKTTKCSCFR